MAINWMALKGLVRPLSALAERLLFYTETKRKRAAEAAQEEIKAEQEREKLYTMRQKRIESAVQFLKKAGVRKPRIEELLDRHVDQLLQTATDIELLEDTAARGRILQVEVHKGPEPPALPE